jgi:hypothetical protein
MHLRMSDGNYGLGLGPAFEAVPVEQRETEKKLFMAKAKDWVRVVQGNL